ncbi:DNA (cytosine-5)-methyltransferase 1 [Chryseobacterium bernardetii]|uniref:DNA (cytosine-5-)-methyltransferase n=2 Tax=Chryseobacterium TaxID=59732 RepID=A0A543EHS7_9FLAO|nr:MULTISPECIES: DNA (cytosine-5-)-methyltransferase [Chryseobacterium]MDR6371076.1 DNA (cytosine-5)-methyltransferase 1 [Chryseobacterium vietnamense]MDR6441178.1 DNA (cytosine-5)-methyltransferase 1 [Chryseobacterium bernardetii]TQM21147.1 DNA (cytosine-5)-methyltransferase 1 [Chryseobacterium aquifrigidense]
MTVVDFFCGAGGFSQGFKQNGFEIIYGYDYWEPAIKTFNYNYELNCIRKNILDFHNNIEEIEKIPNTDIILGSPPCVSFSSSNKSGKADKKLGVKLTEAYFQIIAIKKYQKKSVLKAWFMENVSNSFKYLQDYYTFHDLNLSEWARKNKINPKQIAINLKDNYSIINSADYNSYQNRKRFVCGEIVSHKGFINPEKISHQNVKKIKDLKDAFISPFDFLDKNRIIKDPNYNFFLNIYQVSDHFYDTGIDNKDIKFTKFLKTNHPFMGKMSFPENEENPSRTITATLIASSREAIIYKSEINRNNGVYRLPTIREAAIIMGFPINYQFLGSKNTKWRLIGNAVCVEVSYSLSDTVLKYLGINKPQRNIDLRRDAVDNLNDFTIRKTFKKTMKKVNARFRWHILKDNNLTVTLSNYDMVSQSQVNMESLKWYCSIQYGTGDGFPTKIFDDYDYLKVENFLLENESTAEFIRDFNFKTLSKIGDSLENQEMFTRQIKINDKLELSDLLVSLRSAIDELNISNVQVNNFHFFKKAGIPLSQVLCFYIINKITTKINNNGKFRENQTDFRCQ